ncbi:Hypothetical protein Cul05146_0449 [Corynebacterium ulcerans]|uniref:Transposase n=1 Tax=Corynebacterium ulcerans FRC58 TaxID=1408268 RepID=A0ABM5TYU9_CORUL|nr:Hypothetical protein Cul05146_0449 [Corynebacterium ulcerans]AKN76329.1 Hypothetical protein CulFRC58_0475 [Corynebacterium ulcerans FRC58]
MDKPPAPTKDSQEHLYMDNIKAPLHTILQIMTEKVSY